MDAERQTHLKRRHDLMAELFEELPSRGRLGRASENSSSRKDPPTVEKRSVPCQNIKSVPVKQTSWLSVSDERPQTSTTETEKETMLVMQTKTPTKWTLSNQTSCPVKEVLSESVTEPNISNFQKPNGPLVASKAALHKPEIYENGGQYVCVCSQNLGWKNKCSRRGSLSKDDMLFCRVCGAAEMCWMTHNQEKLFKSHVCKEEWKRRREHKKASRAKEIDRSQGQCVLL